MNTRKPQKRTETAIIFAIAIGAIVAPIAFSIHMAKVQNFDDEKKHVTAYAEDVLNRSVKTADQINAGIDDLKAHRGPDPCSQDQIDRMREIAVSSKYLQAIGYVSNGNLICSSLGIQGAGIPLGPVDMVTARGVRLRADAHFSFAPGKSFLVVERDGYAAIVHKDLPVDVTSDERALSLATFSRENGRILAQRGIIRPEWIKPASSQAEPSVFSDGRYLIVVLSSSRYLIGSVAALPLTALEQTQGSTAFWIIPVGITAGLLLALAVFYLVQLQQSMPTAIKFALRRDEFFMLYQPVVDLQTGQWVGAEALIRWQRGNGELIPPDIFVPVAESSGLIQKITRRVVELVGNDAANLFRQHPDFHLAINFSASDLHSADCLDLLDSLAQSSHAGQNNLIVEATERGFLSFEKARDVVSRIRQSGIRTAIDDFGTGYSSLSYLENLEIDILKIDKSFIDTIGTDAPTSHVVIHIIELAKDLGLTMIAEGVETEAQAEFLRERGVRYAQGWLYSKAITMEALRRDLRNPGIQSRPADNEDQIASASD